MQQRSANQTPDTDDAEYGDLWFNPLVDAGLGGGAGFITGFVYRAINTLRGVHAINFDHDMMQGSGEFMVLGVVGGLAIHFAHTANEAYRAGDNSRGNTNRLLSVGLFAVMGAASELLEPGASIERNALGAAARAAVFFVMSLGTETVIFAASEQPPESED